MTPIGILLVAAALVAALIGLGGGYFVSRGEVKGVRFPSLFFAGISFAVSFLVLAIGLVEEVPAGFMAVQGDKIAVVAHDSMEFLWEWDDRLKDAQIVSWKQELASADIRSQPITANPSVQQLVITAEIRIGVSPEKKLAYLNSDWSPQPDKRLAYWLYEFDRAHHAGFVEFYNPESSEQQESLEQLAKEFLEPHMEGTGVELVSVRFARPIN